MSGSRRRRLFEAALLLAAVIASLATSNDPNDGPVEGGASYSEWFEVSLPPASSESFRAVTDWGTVLALDVEPHGVVILEGASLPSREGLELLADADLVEGTVVPGVGTVLAADEGNGLYEIDPDDGEEIDRHVGDDPLDAPRYEGYFTLWNGSDETVDVRVRAAAIAGPKPDAPLLRGFEVR